MSVMSIIPGKKGAGYVDTLRKTGVYYIQVGCTVCGYDPGGPIIIILYIVYTHIYIDFHKSTHLILHFR